MTSHLKKMSNVNFIPRIHQEQAYVKNAQRRKMHFQNELS